MEVSGDIAHNSAIVRAENYRMKCRNEAAWDKDVYSRLGDIM